IAAYAAEQRLTVGLMANGSWPRADQPIKVLPGRAPSQLTSVLEALAAVTPFATDTVEDLLSRESPRLPWGATLVVVTGMLTPELLWTLQRLRQVGRRVVLVSLAQQAPPQDELVGIPWFHLPRGNPAARDTDDAGSEAA
ncbi:MAG: hypothetical protein GX605_10740, partial [Chloroflexi bacterium]|nr:hypothetical protein [Chloroflexota bacterium]